jgi:hypothetical protein
MAQILQFPSGSPRSAIRYVHRRRHGFPPMSLHVYRRALLRRFGLASGERPACVFNELAQALLHAQVKS